jgi:hypothetical protein
LAVLAPAHGLPIYPRPCRPGGRPNVRCYVSDRDGERWLLRRIQEHYRVAAVPLDTTEERLTTIEKQAIQMLAPYATRGGDAQVTLAVMNPSAMRETPA